MEFLNQVTGGFHGSASCEQVIVEQNNVVFIDGVFVDFDSVDSIFFSITLLYGFAGEFPGFLQSTTPAPRRMAKAEDMTKPRDSMPTIFVMPLSL